MKKYIFFAVFLYLLIGCSYYNEHKIIGTWVIFDPFNGLKELTFSKNNIIMKVYQYGEEPHIEINSEYKIIDNIIFVKHYDTTNYYLDSPFYYYSINKNKLILQGFHVDIYSKKIKRKLKDTLKYLNGNWILENNNIKYELIFNNDNVNIIQYNESGNIKENNITRYKINDYYLNIENIMDMKIEGYFGNIWFINDNLLYHISNDTLILVANVARGDVARYDLLYFNKK